MIHKCKMFLARQVTQIRQGGTRVLYGKAMLVVRKVICLPVSVPFVLLIRILQPVIKVRFICFDAGRIGHFEDANVYLATKIDKEVQSNILDIVYFVVGTGQVSNKQYLKMWRRVLHTPPLSYSRLLESIDKINKKLPGRKMIYHGERVNLKTGVIDNRIIENVLSHVDSPISFTSEEHILGRKMLLELGIPEKKQFICFHARDSAYLDSLMTCRDWSYHDFRDSNIRNYLPAVEKMIECDYYAIRMGSRVKERLDTDNPQIIDYASNGNRSDFLDIYLFANCRFLLISDTGLSGPSEVFRKPIVYVNDFLFGLLFRLSVQNCIFIFKKYYLIQEERFLTYAEIAANSDLLFLGSGEFEKRGIEVVENTEEEILAVTIEMEKRLSGTWVPEKEDEELQAQFWSLFPTGLSKSPNCRIGAQFLRDNSELFMLPSNSKSMAE